MGRPKFHIPAGDGDGFMCGVDSMVAVVTGADLCSRCLTSYESILRLLDDVRSVLWTETQNYHDNVIRRAALEGLVARIDRAPKGRCAMKEELTYEERVAMLSRAEGLIREVIASMPVTESKCAHCERTTYSNWDRHLKRDQLKAMVEKLRRISIAMAEAGKEAV